MSIITNKFITEFKNLKDDDKLALYLTAKQFGRNSSNDHNMETNHLIKDVLEYLGKVDISSDSCNKFKRESKKYLILDVETTGLPKKPTEYKLYCYKELDKYENSRIIQISWLVSSGIYSEETDELMIQDYIVKPDNFPVRKTEYHKITKEIANEKGKQIVEIFEQLSYDLKKVDYIVAHNLEFDYNMICSELYRYKLYDIINEIDKLIKIDTMKIRKHRISLSNLYAYLFSSTFDNKHNSKYDVLATSKILKEINKKCLIESKIFDKLKIQFSLRLAHIVLCCDDCNCVDCKNSERNSGQGV